MPLQENLLAPRPAWLPEALGTLGRHGFLTARQLAAVLDVDHDDVDPALEALVVEGLLQTLLPTHAPGGGPLSAAYLLTRTGIRLLRTLDERAPITIVRPEKSRYTLAHDLLRNEFALVLERLAKQDRLALHRFETAREKIAAMGYVATRGLPERVPLVADGLAVLAVNGTATAILVEIDRGTTSASKMATKYRGYLSWLRDGGPARRFGVKSLRVLTVAPTASRQQRLREAALEATDGRGSGFFWFAPESALDAVNPQQLLAPVCTVARAGEPLSERLFA